MSVTRDRVRMKPVFDWQPYIFFSLWVIIGELLYIALNLS